MNHQSDTPASFSSVPGHTRLFRREPGGTYYLRAKVPQALRAIVGKVEIRVSLKTKDLKEGRERVKFESIRVDQLFKDAEARLRGLAPKYSHNDLQFIVAEWFVAQDAKEERWAGSKLPHLDPTTYADIMDTLKGDIASSGTLCPESEEDASFYLDQYLQGEGKKWGIQKESEDYSRLVPLFRRARSELFTRQLNRMETGTSSVGSFDPAFAHLHSTTILQSPAPAQATETASRKNATLGELLEDFSHFQKENRSAVTPKAYALVFRLLRELFGESTPVASITPEDIAKFGDVLRRIPVNMAQRYPGMKVEKAMAAAAAANDTRTLGPKTLQNYYVLLKAVFNYAHAENYISEVPTKSRKLAEVFRIKNQHRKRPCFTIEELNAIFRAPLYTGCVDDDRGYATRGPMHPRRGRFWVPLIALFSGFRCNEICQLYVADIGEEDGIPYFHARLDLGDDEETEKSLKTSTSQRKVPVHPELLKIGFMDYVEGRRRDTASPRLFPDLPADHNGRYSNIFSKWFGRFLASACGYKPKATFHSLRHHFRSILLNQGVQLEFASELGGWKSENSAESVYRHYQMPKLLEHISKVNYPGLSLEHLYSEQQASSGNG